MKKSNTAITSGLQLSRWGKVDAIQGSAFIVKDGYTQALSVGSVIQLDETLQLFHESTVMVTFESGQTRIFYGNRRIIFDKNTMEIVDQETQTPSKKNRHDFDKIKRLIGPKNESYDLD